MEYLWNGILSLVFRAVLRDWFHELKLVFCILLIIVLLS